MFDRLFVVAVGLHVSEGLIDVPRLVRSHSPCAALREDLKSLVHEGETLFQDAEEPEGLDQGSAWFVDWERRGGEEALVD